MDSLGQRPFYTVVGASRAWRRGIRKDLNKVFRGVALVPTITLFVRQETYFAKVQKWVEMRDSSKLLVRFIMCVLIVGNGGICHASDDIKDILLQTKSHINSVKSLSYISEDQRIGPNGNVVLNNQQDFKYDTGRYYAAARSLDKEKAFGRTIAYDGKFYQELNPQQASLYLRRKINNGRIRYPGPEALVMAYGFAIEPLLENDLSIDALKRDDTWNRLSEVSTYIGSKNIRGHECHVVKFALNAPNNEKVIYEVAFADDLGMFPIHFEAKLNDTKLVAVQDVEDYMVDNKSKQPVILPLTIVTVGYDEDGNKHHVTKINVDKNTVEINKNIPESVFTIPRNQLRVVFDYDINAGLNKDVNLLEALEYGSNVEPNNFHNTGVLDQESEARSSSARDVSNLNDSQNNTSYHQVSISKYIIVGTIVLLLAVIIGYVLILIKMKSKKHEK